MPPHPPPKPPAARADAELLAQLLSDVATGRQSVSEALNRLVARPEIPSEELAGYTRESIGDTASEDLRSRQTDPAGSPDGVTLDLDRQRRCGFPEVIYGAGKPAEMISAIIRRQSAAGQPSFATRIDREIADSVVSEIPSARFNPIARTLSTASGEPRPIHAIGEDGASKIPPHVAVVTAGSTDAPVAEEAIETLHWMGLAYRAFDDIGVAGPQRLLNAVPRLREATAVIVIAGMEGALPAAVGGHLDAPIFAVPTSVGYGVTLGGLTPLFGMLSCCASNVAVVNIDAGFKAAYLAGLVIRPHLAPAP